MSSGITLYLVRHASTDWNDEGRWQCLDDRPINDRRLAQAEAVSKAFVCLSEKRGFSKVYSSPLIRARQTAEPIARGLGLEVVLEPPLGSSTADCCRGLGPMRRSRGSPTSTPGWKAIGWTRGIPGARPTGSTYRAASCPRSTGFALTIPAVRSSPSLMPVS